MTRALIETIREQERELVELKALTREAETIRQKNVGELHRQAGQQRGKSLTRRLSKARPRWVSPPPRAARKRGSSCRVAGAGATAAATRCRRCSATQQVGRAQR
jgi:hypothetical protein